MTSIHKRFTHSSPTLKASVTLLILLILAFILPVTKSPFDTNNVLSAASIFYSILLGYYIAAAMSNLSRLKTLVATETGALIALHRITRLSLPHKEDDITQAIDRYLIKRFDYEVSDYSEPTTNEFFAIFDVMKGAEPKSTGESAALNYLGEAMYYIAQARRELTIVGARIVDSMSWILLETLSAIIVVTLFLTRDGSPSGALVAAFLSSAAILALFILDDVDGNRFGEEQFAINTYQHVFRALNLLPYYPNIYLDAGRYKPTDATYRTGNSANVVVVNQSTIAP